MLNIALLTTCLLITIANVAFAGNNECIRKAFEPAFEKCNLLDEEYLLCLYREIGVLQGTEKDGNKVHSLRLNALIEYLKPHATNQRALNDFTKILETCGNEDSSQNSLESRVNGFDACVGKSKDLVAQALGCEAE